MGSPSTRREWIEIESAQEVRELGESPSTRREWIEILTQITHFLKMRSPSTRREWIEIGGAARHHPGGHVSLHTEGVD